MERQYITHLKLTGEKINSKKIQNNYVVQNPVIYCDNYYYGHNINFQKKFINFLENHKINDDSIYGISSYYSEYSVAYKPLELLDEVSKFGYEIYKLCKKDLKKINIVCLSGESFIENSLKQIESNKLLSVFIKWCKKYHFPCEVDNISIDKSNDPYRFYIYELTFVKIIELAKQLLLIYLIDSYYIDLTYLMKIKKFTEIEDSSYDSLEKHMVNLNQKNRILGINCRQLKLDELYDLDKSRIIHSCVKGMLTVFNLFRDKFNNSNKQYFSYIDENIYCQTLYSNVFDCCWNTIIRNYRTINVPKRLCARL